MRGDINGVAGPSLRHVPDLTRTRHVRVITIKRLAGKHDACDGRRRPVWNRFDSNETLPSHFVGHFDAVRRRLRTVTDEEIGVRTQTVVVQIRYVERPRVQYADVARP